MFLRAFQLFLRFAGFRQFWFSGVFAVSGAVERAGVRGAGREDVGGLVRCGRGWASRLIPCL